jgi:HSP20 family protein
VCIISSAAGIRDRRVRGQLPWIFCFHTQSRIQEYTIQHFQSIDFSLLCFSVKINLLLVVETTTKQEVLDMFRRFLPDLKKNSLQTQRPTSMADMLEDFWKHPFEFMPFRDLHYPAVDISENDEKITVKAELPGMDPKDVDLSLENDRLIIRGEKKFEDEEKKDNYHRMERSYGSFSRTIALPSPVQPDNIKAKFKKGVLTVTLDKAPEERGKKIQIEE